MLSYRRPRPPTPLASGSAQARIARSSAQSRLPSKVAPDRPCDRERCHLATQAMLTCRRRASISVIAVAVILDVGAARYADERLTIRHGDHQHAVAFVDEGDLLSGPPSQAFPNRLGD